MFYFSEPMKIFFPPWHLNAELLGWDLKTVKMTCPGDEIILSMVKCLLLFACFCGDEISSRDELISVTKTGMKFYPRMKKRKKRCANTSSQDEILKWAFFFKNIWHLYSNMLSKVNMFKHNESMKVRKHRPLYKVKSEKKKDENNK